MLKSVLMFFLVHHLPLTSPHIICYILNVISRDIYEVNFCACLVNKIYNEIIFLETVDCGFQVCVSNNRRILA